MDEQTVRQIIQQEIARKEQSNRFQTQNSATSGSVSFTNTGTFTFNTNFTPKLITFYGNPIHTSSGTPDIHTFVFGQAALSRSLYFQPQSSSAVQTGGQYELVQTCTMFMAIGSSGPATFQTIASQGHLISVQESGDVVARATVSGYGKTSFTITVDTLSSGWTIVGNYFVM